MANYITGSGLEVPGLEAIVEYNGLTSLNDKTKLERLMLTGIGGIQDDADIRDSREDNPDRPGDRARIQLPGARSLTLEGKLRAGSIPAMRDTWARVKAAFNGSEHDLKLRVPNEASLITNVLKNPGAGVNVTDGGWVGTNATVARTTSNQERGAGGFQLTASSAATMSLRNTSDRAVAKPGEVWSAAAFFKSAVTVRSARVYVAFYDATATLISSTAGSNATELTTDFVRAIVEGVVAPPGTASVAIYAEVVSPANAEVHYVDSLMLAKTATIADYADGDQFGVFWDGVPHNSTSTRGAFDVNAIKNPNGVYNQTGYSSTIGATGVMWPSAPAADSDFGDPNVVGSSGGVYSAIKTAPTGSTTVTLQVPATENGPTAALVVPGQWWAIRARVKITHQFTNASGQLTLSARFRNAALGSVATTAVMAANALASYPVGSIVDLSGVIQVPAAARWMGIQIDAAVQTGATGGAIVGLLSAVRVAGSTSSVPDYFDGDYRHCAWSGAKGSTESLRRRPRPFLLKRVRKTDKLGIPEKQANDKAERDFMIVARAADPRIYVVDERTHWMQLSGSPQYVDDTPPFVAANTDPTGYTAIVDTASTEWRDASVINQSGLVLWDASLGNPGDVRSYVYRSAEGYTYTNPVVRLYGLPMWTQQPTNGGIVCIFKRIDNNNYLTATWSFSKSPGPVPGNSFLSIGKIDAGSGSTLVSATAQVGMPYPAWLMVYMNGNVITVGVYTSYPGNLTSIPVPWMTTTTTLAGADATKFGTGVAGHSGFGLTVNGLAVQTYPWIGRYEAADYTTLITPTQLSLPIIGDFDDGVLPSLTLRGDVVNPSMAVILPDGRTRSLSFKGTFAESDPATLDFDVESFATVGGIDRWDTWQPYSDFLYLQPGINTVSALASNWTAGKYHLGFSVQDAYK